MQLFRFFFCLVHTLAPFSALVGTIHPATLPFLLAIDLYHLREQAVFNNKFGVEPVIGISHL